MVGCQKWGSGCLASCRVGCGGTELCSGCADGVDCVAVCRWSRGSQVCSGKGSVGCVGEFCRVSGEMCAQGTGS
jgi:hypothetical protein